MDGGAIYYPSTVVWMAVAQGMDLSFGRTAMILVLGTLGAIGCSPIPNAGMAIILLIAEQVQVPTVGFFPLVMASDVILDRVTTGKQPRASFCSSWTWLELTCV